MQKWGYNCWPQGVYTLDTSQRNGNNWSTCLDSFLCEGRVEMQNICCMRDAKIEFESSREIDCIIWWIEHHGAMEWGTVVRRVAYRHQTSWEWCLLKTVGFQRRSGEKALCRGNQERQGSKEWLCVSESENCQVEWRHVVEMVRSKFLNLGWSHIRVGLKKDTDTFLSSVWPDQY